jgi:(S)-ureidoglycine aminohydrolase
MLTKLGHSRTIIKPSSYALLAPDGHVGSVLPGWTKCHVVVLISAAMGAKFSQYLITLEPGGHGEGSTGDDSWFFFVVSGTPTINGATLSRGGFAYIPPGERYGATASTKPATLLVFRKRYEPIAGHSAPASFSGHEEHVREAPFLGDKNARLKVLIPDALDADMAINVFTYDPGATLPFVETHVMEHGMLFLAGGGIYRLDNDWHPVTSGDAIWIAPYCPQWFIAAGPEPARYIYYKDVNRLPA